MERSRSINPPWVFIFIRALDDLQRENRGSVDRLDYEWTAYEFKMFYSDRWLIFIYKPGDKR